MNYFPKENISFVTSLTDKQIIDRLHENVNPKTATRTGYWAERNTKMYEGEIGRNNFEIMRIINNKSLYNARYTYTPSISGIIIPFGNQTKLNIEIKLDTMAFISVCVLCVMTIGILLAVSMSYFLLHEIRMIFLLPLGGLSLMYVFILYVFNSECNKLKTFIESMFGSSNN